MNRYQLNKDLVNNAIYLDFEGEGKKADKSVPCPHIAGLYRPYLEGYKYSVLFLKRLGSLLNLDIMLRQTG